MSTGGHEDALRGLFADLPAGQERDLLHLATCEICQERVAATLAEREGESGDQEYSALWPRLEADVPILIAQAGRRCAEARALVAELLGYPRRRQLRALREPRFRSRFVVDRLLDQSQDAQLRDPVRSDRLARLAAALAVKMQGPAAADDEDMALCYVRGLSLAGNARRLAGCWAAAEKAFRRADRGLAFSGDPSREQSTYLRYLGLLRWERGQLSRAEAYLRQSARSFGELELDFEQAVGRVLLGLLCLERDWPDRAVRLLQAGRGVMDPGTRPWLTARGSLGAAIGFADLHQTEAASTALADAWRSYPDIRDEREIVRLSWLEGNVQARLGDHRQAGRLLEDARRRLLTEPSLPDAVLCTLDLAILSAETGNITEIQPLLRDLAILFPAEPALGVIRRLARQLDGIHGSHSVDLRSLHRHAAATLRRSLRSRGYRVEALPFV